jgi:hypothetical protein
MGRLLDPVIFILRKKALPTQAEPDEFAHSVREDRNFFALLGRRLKGHLAFFGDSLPGCRDEAPGEADGT